MRIVHFSDWHWEFTDDSIPELRRERLPEADLYVCTGDMYANYPVVMQEEVSQPFQPPNRYWGVDPVREPGFQLQAAKQFAQTGGFRALLSSPDAPIVCVRGNHDFAPLAPLFEGCNVLHEFVNNELIEFQGLKITGHRGIPYIYGTWQDEMQPADLLERVRGMPEADIFVTHYPPDHILDFEYMRGMARANYGLRGMAPLLWNKAPAPKDGSEMHALHCFGHIHGCGGKVESHNGFKFSNAACSVNVIDF
jgi:Icc-related predicted phosphoesterase